MDIIIAAYGSQGERANMVVRCPNQWAYFTVKLQSWIRVICSLWELIVEVDLGGWKPQQGAYITMNGLGTIGLVEDNVLTTQSSPRST